MVWLLKARIPNRGRWSCQIINFYCSPAACASLCGRWPSTFLQLTNEIISFRGVLPLLVTKSNILLFPSIRHVLFYIFYNFTHLIHSECSIMNVFLSRTINGRLPLDQFGYTRDSVNCFETIRAKEKRLLYQLLSCPIRIQDS